MNMYKAACTVFPYTEYTPRRCTQSLRVKWIKAVRRLGPKWLVSRENFVKRKDHV